MSVLEPTGIPVTGTPSISLEFKDVQLWLLLLRLYQQVIIDGEPVTGILVAPRLYVEQIPFMLNEIGMNIEGTDLYFLNRQISSSS